MVHFIRNFTFDLEENSDKDLEKYLDDKVWKEITQIVQEVEKAILLRSDDLNKFGK